MIYVLRGNTIRDIGLPLQLLTVEETGETITDYYPSSSDTIEVNMVSSCSSESMEVTVEDNYLHWTWVPTITGTYGIEVKITQEDGTAMRSYRKQQVRVYNSNDQLPEDDGEVEFVSEYLVLDTTTILFVKGETGDTGPTGNGIESIEKTSTSGLVDYYTITYTDGTTSSFTVTNGQNADISAANAAILAANTAATTANDAASLANEKANLANEAATSAANAADNATSAAYTANTYATAANSAAGAANAAAIDANNATTAATTATEAANTATTNANNAATAANSAASSANSAASDASSAATSANTAATSANSAATSANSAASTANTAAEAATTAAAYNNELNISAIYPTDGTDSGNTYTLANAIAKVPSDSRKEGLKVTFISDGTDTGLVNGNPYTYQYMGTSWAVANFERVDALRLDEMEASIDRIDDALEFEEDVAITASNYLEGGYYVNWDSLRLYNVTGTPSLQYLAVAIFPLTIGKSYEIVIPKSGGNVLSFNNTGASTSGTQTYDSAGLTKNVYVKHTFTAAYSYAYVGYQSASGRPALTQVDLSGKIGDFESRIAALEAQDVSRKADKSIGKNLFTTENQTLNKRLDASGNLSTYNGYNVTDYIPVEAETAYYLSASGDAAFSISTFYICFYNSSKTFISSVGANTKAVTTPSGAAYLRATYTASMSELQIELGTERTYYRPYNEIGGYLEYDEDIINGHDEAIDALEKKDIDLDFEVGYDLSALDKIETTNSFVITSGTDYVTITRNGTSAGGAGVGFYLGGVLVDGEKYEIEYEVTSTHTSNVIFAFSTKVTDATTRLSQQIMVATASSTRNAKSVFTFNADYPYLSTYRSYITTNGASMTFTKITIHKVFADIYNANQWKYRIVGTYGDSITAAGNSENVEYPYTGTSWQRLVGNQLEIGKMYNRGMGNQRFIWVVGGYAICWADESGYSPTDWRVDGVSLDNFDAALAAGTAQYPTGITMESDGYEYYNYGESDQKKLVRFRGSFCSWSRIVTQFPSSIKDSIDAVLIMGGTNDQVDNTDFEFVANDTTDPEWAASSYYSSYNGDYNIENLKGAIASTIMKMQAWMPRARIIMMTPCSSEGVAAATKDFSLITNNYTKSQYIREMASIMSLPLIDVNASVGINGFNRDEFLADSTHPFTGGGRRNMATAIVSGLQNIFPYLYYTYL